MLAAARLDPTINVIPNRVVDITTLVQNIRRFIADIGGPSTMSLPPADKATRKSVHELAIAFNLKSVSKGKGEARYTTLTKTTRTGFGVNEKKVGQIMRRGSGRGYEFVDGGKGDWKKGGGGPRHREGDVVGEVIRFLLSPFFSCSDAYNHRQLRRLTNPIKDSRCWRPWAGQRARESVCLAVWMFRWWLSSKRVNLVWGRRKKIGNRCYLHHVIVQIVFVDGIHRLYGILELDLLCGLYSLFLIVTGRHIEPSVIFTLQSPSPQVDERKQV